MSQHDTQRDTHIDVGRRIAADPASAVLLLAAPAAAELWPGVALESAQPGDQIRLYVRVPPAAADLAGLSAGVSAVVQAEPPQRTPTAFVVRFSFSAAGVPATTGTLMLTYARGEGDETSATIARLSFAADQATTPGFVAALEYSARRFLDKLAAAAENRSRAA